MSPAKRLSVDERKKEIMEAARKIIIIKGLENTTMEDIISETTLSRGGVYHYYKSVVDIFKDIMFSGIEYRNKIIKSHLNEIDNLSNNEFIAKQLVDKVIDKNPYTPLYVEFLICKKRIPELNNIMDELQERTKEKLNTIFNNDFNWIYDSDTFLFINDFINTLILASDILDVRENFKKNRHLLEKMFIYILERDENNGSL
ncbi:TetR/AcrR family transcriptional regulator [Streptobacillus moniliformis]|uniref:TetR/AcrR family transcriptional regulator n=1 Tax=Streptobacillus moniliformis TaxID=34105 RepID=UPI0007E33E63|nr:TetR/AcrR family transcriptional regulator [Streptobacillus moniliformis]